MTGMNCHLYRQSSRIQVEYLYESLTDNSNSKRKTIQSRILIYVECLTRPRSRNRRFANVEAGNKVLKERRRETFVEDIRKLMR